MDGATIIGATHIVGIHSSSHVFSEESHFRSLNSKICCSDVVMLISRGLRAISRPPSRVAPAMPLNKFVSSTAFSGHSPGAGTHPPRPWRLPVGIRFKACSDRHDHGIFTRLDAQMGNTKAHVLAPYRHDSAFLLGEDVGSKPVNGSTGSPLRFLDRSGSNKLVVAVDVDEVLGRFLAAVNSFIADRYKINHSISEYYVYEFFKIWNCSRAEADIRVHEFFKTSYFKTGIHPIPGARHILHKLSEFCQLSIVTSRQNAIKDHTLEWIEEHYPGLFQEIHFGNHFALDGQSKPKSEICRSLGAQVLIDDNPRYALDCAEVGIRVLLFDYDNSYPWCKTGSAASHPLVTKVHNWQEVEQHLVSWAAVS